MSSSESRIAAARARSAAAKNWLAAAAIAMFLATMLAVRAGQAAQSQTGSSSSSVSDDAFQQDDGYFDSGTLTPSYSEPQTATGSS